jgi:AraC-like DNA-binding protein
MGTVILLLIINESSEGTDIPVFEEAFVSILDLVLFFGCLLLVIAGFRDLRKKGVQKKSYKSEPVDGIKISRFAGTSSDLLIKLPADNEQIYSDAYVIGTDGTKVLMGNEILVEPEENRSSLNDGKTGILLIMLTSQMDDNRSRGRLLSTKEENIVRSIVPDNVKTRLANLLKTLEIGRLNNVGAGNNGRLTSEPRSTDDKFMEKVYHIIDENMTDFDFGVGMLHERLGMSRMHLSRKLKNHTGLSPHILIRNMRLERAAGLILRKSGNITEIANSVGISNASGFSRAFRNHFGVSPRKYPEQF